MSWISAVIAFVGAISTIDRWVNLIRRLWQKSPVDEQAKQDKAHDEAAKNAETKDDTDGLFKG